LKPNLAYCRALNYFAFAKTDKFIYLIEEYHDMTMKNNVNVMKGTSISCLKLILRNKNPHKEVVIPKSTISNPEAAGFKRTWGEFKGQLADYGCPLENGGRIHLMDYGDYYKAHRDLVDPDRDPIGHLIYDAPIFFILGTSAAGGFIGAILCDKDRPKGALHGALIGFVGSVAVLIICHGSAYDIPWLLLALVLLILLLASWKSS
jgi:hypothetical protein